MKVEDIARRVVGARIMGIATHNCFPTIHGSSIECDEGNIYIVLDNGLVIKVWNSEWGGIDIISIDEAEIDSEQLKKIVRNMLGKLADKLEDLE